MQQQQAFCCRDSSLALLRSPSVSLVLMFPVVRLPLSLSPLASHADADADDDGYCCRCSMI